MARRPMAEIRPRIVTDTQLAQYLEKSTSWLAAHRLELEAQGLPRRLPAVGGNDLHLVDSWIDGLTQAPVETEDPEIRELWKRITRNVAA
jgi:hypothetical protein